MRSNETYVLVGGGYAAARAADCLRQEGFDGRIVLVSEERHLPYSRPPLCKKALTMPMDIGRLSLRQRSFYESNRIEMKLGKPVTSIDRHARRITVGQDETLDYDRMLLATGGRPRRLPIPGNDLAGVHVIRNYEDTLALQRDFAPGRKLVIIGAGYIGMETAAAAINQGLMVTVVELSPRIMSRVAAPATSEFFTRNHMNRGVELLLHRSAMSFDDKDGRVARVNLDDGQSVDADLVLMAAGNIPEFRLAAEAKLDCEGGIIVDDRCRTSDPLIFAAGDCTRHPSVRYGRRIQLESVDNALEQARVAAAGMCGRKAQHSHVPWFWSDQYDLKLQIIGLSDGFDEMVVRGDPDQSGFSVWYLRASEVLCMETVNNPLEFMQAGRWIGARVKVDPRVLHDSSRPLDDALVNSDDIFPSQPEPVLARA